MAIKFGEVPRERAIKQKAQKSGMGGMDPNGFGDPSAGRNIRQTAQNLGGMGSDRFTHSYDVPRKNPAATKQ